MISLETFADDEVGHTHRFSFVGLIHAKKEVTANELTGVKVTQVLLMSRGAKRISFPVQKGDEDMLNLNRLFKGDLMATRVVAVVVAKSADSDALRKAIIDTSVNAEELSEVVVLHHGAPPKPATGW